VIILSREVFISFQRLSFLELFIVVFIRLAKVIIFPLNDSTLSQRFSGFYIVDNSVNFFHKRIHSQIYAILSLICFFSQKYSAYLIFHIKLIIIASRGCPCIGVSDLLQVVKTGIYEVDHTLHTAFIILQQKLPKRTNRVISYRILVPLGLVLTIFNMQSIFGWPKSLD
jgi:hypothetical protein